MRRFRGDMRSIIGHGRPHRSDARVVGDKRRAGRTGVGITLLISIPVNLAVQSRFGVYPIAELPLVAGMALVAISVALTLLAGVIPAGRAAREDPVEALRSE